MQPFSLILHDPKHRRTMDVFLDQVFVKLSPLQEIKTFQSEVPYRSFYEFFTASSCVNGMRVPLCN